MTARICTRVQGLVAAMSTMTYATTLVSGVTRIFMASICLTGATIVRVADGAMHIPAAAGMPIADCSSVIY